jgi:hypothetical protein
MDFPLLVSVTSLALMVLSTWVGDALRKRAGIPEEDRRNESANLMAGAILTLLFFLIGFTFSMAIHRYFFLIADLDSPRGGAIRVTPQNLSILSRSLPAAQ